MEFFLAKILDQTQSWQSLSRQKYRNNESVISVHLTTFKIDIGQIILLLVLILLWRHLLEKFLELICFRSSKAQEILLDYAGIDPGSSWFWVRRLHHSAIMLFLKVSDLKYLYLQVISSNSDFKRIWTNWTFVYDYLIIYSWSLYYWVCYKTYFLLICQIYYLFTYITGEG